MEILSVEKKVELEKRLEESKHKAEELIKDKEKTEDTIDEAIKKANKIEEKGVLDKIWDDLPHMFGMAKDWITGKYKEIPISSIIAILGGIIYFLSPIDIIPDFIPIIGYLDDIFVLNLVIDQVRKDIDKYKEWNKLNK